MVHISGTKGNCFSCWLSSSNTGRKLWQNSNLKNLYDFACWFADVHFIKFSVKIIYFLLSYAKKTKKSYTYTYFQFRMAYWLFFECCVVYFSENHYPLMMFLNSHFHPSAFCSCGYNFLITADQRINVLHIKIETVLNIDVFEYTLRLIFTSGRGDNWKCVCLAQACRLEKHGIFLQFWN